MKLFRAATFLLFGAKALAAAAAFAGANELEETQRRRTTDTKYKSTEQADGSAAISSEVKERELQEDIYMSIGEDMSMSVDYEQEDELNDENESALTEIRFPENFSFEAMFDTSNDETLYSYIVNVAGNKASITSVTDTENEDNNSVLYFDARAHVCGEPNTSLMKAKFQEFNPKTGVASNEKRCYKAPEGYTISEGLPVFHAQIVQFFHAIGDLCDGWIHDGVIQTQRGKADVWKRSDGEGRTEIHRLKSGKQPFIYYRSRITGKDGGDALLTINFSDFKEYGTPEEVPDASLSDDEKDDCIVMDASNGNFEKCEDVMGDPLQAALEALEESLEKKFTGSVSFDEEEISFPATEKDYEFMGSEEEQEMISNLKSFVPGMVGRQMLRVRNQSQCGSCYSFAASHTITSTFNMANPGSDVEFSNQHIMNCATLSTYVIDQGEGKVVVGEGISTDSGSGCWGGNGGEVMNMLVGHLNGKLPTLEQVPYVGFQGYCDPNVVGTNTGITGYASITNATEMKNALYFRGDVAIAFDSDQLLDEYSDPSDIAWPSDDKEEHEEAYLGKGASGPTGTGHAVVVVGWGPCEVEHCVTGEVEENAECWIIQNSWGASRGLNEGGYDLVHTDPDCDLGVISVGGAYIPLMEPSAQTDSSDGSRVAASLLAVVVSFIMELLI